MLDENKVKGNDNYDSINSNNSYYVDLNNDDNDADCLSHVAVQKNEVFH